MYIYCIYHCYMCCGYKFVTSVCMYILSLPYIMYTNVTLHSCLIYTLYALLIYTTLSPQASRWRAAATPAAGPTSWPRSWCRSSSHTAAGCSSGPRSRRYCSRVSILVCVYGLGVECVYDMFCVYVHE